MKLNSEKCQFASFQKKYKIWKSSEVKFLGVKIDKKLKFHSHFAKTKCTKQIGEVVNF